MQITMQSAVLGHPNAMHFGTAIAPLTRKRYSIVFSLVRAFLSFKSHHPSKTKKSTHIRKYSFYRDDRMQITMQSAVLGHPNAMHFGTAIAPLTRKRYSIVFLLVRAFISFKSHHPSKQKRAPTYVSTLFNRDDRI